MKSKYIYTTSSYYVVDVNVDSDELHSYVIFRKDYRAGVPLLGAFSGDVNLSGILKTECLDSYFLLTENELYSNKVFEVIGEKEIGRVPISPNSAMVYQDRYIRVNTDICNLITDQDPNKFAFINIDMLLDLYKKEVFASVMHNLDEPRVFTTQGLAMAYQVLTTKGVLPSYEKSNIESRSTQFSKRRENISYSARSENPRRYFSLLGEQIELPNWEYPEFSFNN